jgi:hypothetical protein
LVGVRNGYDEAKDSQTVIDDINSCEANVVLVAMGIINMLLFCRVFGCRFATIFQVLWPSYLASAIMLAVCLVVKAELPAALPDTLHIIAICFTGGVVYLLLGLLVFRGETKNFLHEGLSIAPAKFSPALMRLQGWLRLH